MSLRVLNKTKNPNTKIIVDEVLNNIEDKQKYGLNEEITIIDYDSKRIYIKTEGEEFTIRMWDIVEIEGNTGRVDWSMFIIKGVAGIKIGEGSSILEFTLI